MTWRVWSICAAFAASVGSSGTASSADSYPVRPIRLVVPYPAGGPADTLARFVAPGLGSLLGGQVVIDNRGGAGPPFIVSAVLIDGAISEEFFSEARIRDARVHALVDKVSVKEDPEMTKRFPAEIPWRIDLRTRGGESKSASASFPRGHFRNPMTDDEVANKFATRGAVGSGTRSAAAKPHCIWNWQMCPITTAQISLDFLDSTGVP